MSQTVLHVLSQRPSFTGSGITLDALVRHAQAAGWDQHVVVGTPGDDAAPEVGGLSQDRIHPLRFATKSKTDSSDVPFAVPGMSDVMPYPSTRFSAMTSAQVKTYKDSWTDHLRRIVSGVRPDVIHGHHVWLLSSLLKDVAPDIPVVLHGHGTGLRQLQLCPKLGEHARAGCQHVERLVVLHTLHAQEYSRWLGLDLQRIRVVGAGYREDLFHRRGRSDEKGATILYAGKISRAKGLPWLLDAMKALTARIPSAVLHIVGSGAGKEADTLRERIVSMGSSAVLHGRVDQPQLANLMRQSALFVLPSLYEGLPLVLVEACACGCRVVSSELPGIVEGICPHLGDAVNLVPLPPLKGVDEPEASAAPDFARRLSAAMADALAKPPPQPCDLDDRLAAFTWQAVYQRINAIWHEVTAG